MKACYFLAAESHSRRGSRDWVWSWWMVLRKYTHCNLQIFTKLFSTNSTPFYPPACCWQVVVWYNAGAKEKTRERWQVNRSCSSALRDYVSHHALRFPVSWVHLCIWAAKSACSGVAVVSPIEIYLARVSGSGLILLDLLHGTDRYHGLVGALFLNPMGCDILSQ
jgi:hypothetical protein